MKSFKRRVLLILVIIMAALISLTACTVGNMIEDAAEEQENAESPDLTIEYAGQDIVVSMDDIRGLEEIEREVTPVPKEDEEMQARHVKGVLLEDVLQKFAGISQKDPQAIRLIAGDGYSIEVPADLLKTREIILAYEVDGKPLEGSEKPLRSIVPDVFEMYWVKNLIKIEIVESRIDAEVARIIMMESRISYIPQQEYDYYGEADKAVSISDLLIGFDGDEESENVFAMGVDGLEKNEKPEIFKSAYIKYTGQDSPIFLSEDLPKGMWIKKILYFTYGSSAYFSVAGGFEVMEKETVDGKESIRLSDIFTECCIGKSEKYIFKALDNYSVEIEEARIGQGYIYMQENGLPAAIFKDMPDNNKVKDLLYIDIAE